jgi:hypothetical protein
MKDLDRNDIMAKAEMGFIKVIVQPLWTVVNNFLNKDFDDALKNILKNGENWEKLYNACSKEKDTNSFLLMLIKEEREDTNGSEDSFVRDELFCKRSKSLVSSMKNKAKEIKSGDKLSVEGNKN